MRREILEVFLCVLFVVSGQLLLKHAVSGAGEAGLTTFWRIFPRVALNPWSWLSLACFAATSFVWMSVLSRVNLSLAYPLFSLAYVLVAVGSVVFFREKIALMHWAGILLIVLGCSLIARSPAASGN